MNTVEWQVWQNRERAERKRLEDAARHQLQQLEERESFVELVLKRLGDFAPALISGPVVRDSYYLVVPIHYHDKYGRIRSAGAGYSPIVELNLHEMRLYESTSPSELADWLDRMAD